MFRDPTTDPLPPHPKTPRFQIRPHHLDHLRLGQAGLLLNLVKGRAILPRHSDHSIP